MQLLRKHVKYTQYLSILIHIYPMSQLVPCPASAAKERFFPSSHASDFKAQVWHLGVEVRGVACNRFNRFRFANMSRAMQGCRQGRAMLKRPAYQKKQAWKKVAYTRDKLGKEIRADRHSWKRSLPELLSASESSLIKKLKEDKLLPSWERRCVQDVKRVLCRSFDVIQVMEH